MSSGATARSPLELPLVRLRLRFEAEGAEALPAYTGSAWRGALGHALRRAACITRQEDCGACLLLHGCPYAYLFETPPPPDGGRMRKYRTAPHPFVLEPPERFEPEPSRPQGPEQALGLAVVGRACRHLPYLIYALARAGEQGIGRARVRHRLVAVEQEDPPGSGRWRLAGNGRGPLGLRPPRPAEPRPLPERVALRLLTPLRLVRDEALVPPDRFRFSDLLRNLLRRLGSLHHFHGPGPLEADYRALAQASEAVAWEGTSLRWHDWTRYSTRQRTAMRMGGLVGRVELEGRALAPFWAWVQAGELVHAGKATSMGLGRYALEAAS